MQCNPKKCRRFNAFRILLFFAGLTLIGYVPYKMFAQPEVMTGLYGIIFPSASLLAVAAMVFALKPAWAFRLPFGVSLLIGLHAAAWLTTGLECIPTMTRAIMTHPLGGMFATLHMSLQHIVLSLGLGTLLLAPRATYDFFGIPMTDGEDALSPKLASENV